MIVGVVENGTLDDVRTDRIGRAVFATDDAGVKVWEATYLPVGGVHTSSGPNSNLRFPGAIVPKRNQPAPKLDAGLRPDAGTIPAG